MYILHIYINIYIYYIYIHIYIYIYIYCALEISRAQNRSLSQTTEGGEAGVGPLRRRACSGTGAAAAGDKWRAPLCAHLLQRAEGDSASVEIFRGLHPNLPNSGKWKLEPVFEIRIRIQCVLLRLSIYRMPLYTYPHIIVTINN